MDTSTISRIIKESLASIHYENIEVSINENDVIFIEVLSEVFKGQRLLKRISLLSELCLEVSMNELRDYTLSFIPLTSNEKKLGLKETEMNTHLDSNHFDISAKSSSLY